MRGRDASDRVVAITGIGMICPLGLSIAQSWDNMLAGRSGIRTITRFDASDCATRIAGELPDAYFRLEKETLPSRFYKRSVLPNRLALLVARQAVEDSRLEVKEIDRRRAAVITGCGGSTFGDQLHLNEKTGKIIPYADDLLNMLSARVSLEFGFRGACFNVATACSSGAFAVHLAADRSAWDRRPVGEIAAGRSRDRPPRLPRVHPELRREHPPKSRRSSRSRLRRRSPAPRRGERRTSP